MKGVVIFLGGVVAGAAIGALARSQIKSVVESVLKEGAELKRNLGEAKNCIREDVEDMAAETAKDMA
jgi:hypothetical protein